MNVREVITALLLPLVLATGAVVLAALLDQQALRIGLQAAAPAAAAVAAWRAAVVFERPRAQQHTSDMTSRSVAADRRAPGVDRTTGLLAPWYFKLRLSEEVLRAERFELPLTLVRFEASAPEAAALRLAVIEETREIDLACDLGTVVMLLLPGTAAPGAAAVAERIGFGLATLETRISSFPDDRDHFEGLRGPREWLPDSFYGAAA